MSGWWSHRGGPEVDRWGHASGGSKGAPKGTDGGVLVEALRAPRKGLTLAEARVAGGWGFGQCYFMPGRAGWASVGMGFCWCGGGFSYSHA